MPLDFIHKSGTISLQRPRVRINAKSTPDTSSKDLELPPLRAVRGRVTVLELAAAVAEPYRAVDPRLHVVLLRGRPDASRGLLVRQRRSRQLRGSNYH